MKLIKGYFIPENDLHYQGYFTQFDHYQEGQRNRALSHVSDWNIAIDIGANIGLWSRDLTSFFSMTYCFEPNINCLDCLKKNINTNKAEIYNLALGSVTSTDYLFSPSNSGGSSFINRTKFLGHDTSGKEIWDKFDKEVPKNKVKIKSLDSFSFNDVDFIKIDVQNYELEVLKGAIETLENNSPIICIEVNNERSEEISFLKKLNYSIIDMVGKEVILKKII